MFKYLFWAWPLGILLMLLFIVFGVVPGMLMRLIGLRRAADKWVYFTVSMGADALFAIVNVHVHVSGDLESLKALKKSGQSVCYVSNHTSMFDIPIVLGPLALSCGFVIKSTMAYVPLVNIMAVALNSVFLNRKSLKSSAKSIKRGVKHIEKGANMLIFPEGTRSKNGEIGQFKRGSFKLATLSQATIIPLTIKGVRAAFEDRDGFFKRIDCYLNVGSPVSTAGLDRHGIFELEDNIEKEIRDTYASLGR